MRTSDGCRLMVADTQFALSIAEAYDTMEVEASCCGVECFDCGGTPVAGEARVLCLGVRLLWWLC